jgi:GNAT superfamily N-acetyltransferase
MSPEFILRKARETDSQVIYELICELAIFEKAPDAVVNTIEQIRVHGWGDQPLFVCWVAEVDQQVVGMALCYTRYSTWKGPVLYLEDLIVTDKHRNKGIGKALFEMCIDHAQKNGFHRLSWQVLDWNEPAIKFYKNYGATFDNEWVNCTIQTFDESVD